MYGIMYKDRKGNATLISDRYTDHNEANRRIMRIIDAQLEVSATDVYHRVGNSIAKFTSWKDDYVEAWRVTA